jgi:hypothetical protein
MRIILSLRISEGFQLILCRTAFINFGLCHLPDDQIVQRNSAANQIPNRLPRKQIAISRCILRGNFSFKWNLSGAVTRVRSGMKLAKLLAPMALNTQRMAPRNSGIIMSNSRILLIIVAILLIAALPTWPYSAGWGYYPSGGLGLVVLILLLLLVFGK